MAKISDLRHIIVSHGKVQNCDCTRRVLNRLHIFSVLHVVFVWWHRIEAVVAAIADLRLGTFRASRFIDSVVQASWPYTFTAAIEEPSIRIRSHARTSVSAARKQEQSGFRVGRCRFKVTQDIFLPFYHAHARWHVSHTTIHRHCFKVFDALKINVGWFWKVKGWDGSLR